MYTYLCSHAAKRISMEQYGNMAWHEYPLGSYVACRIASCGTSHVGSRLACTHVPRGDSTIAYWGLLISHGTIDTTRWMWYWTPISNPLTSWERGYVGVLGFSLSLYLCSLLLVRMHPYTCMTYTMLRPLASYTHTPVPVADVHTYILVLLPRLLFFVYVYHTYLIHIHSMCTCVPYSTRSVPHHTVPQYWYSATPLTHLHVRSQVHIYSLFI